MDPSMIQDKSIAQHLSPNTAERPAGMQPSLIVLHSTDGDCAGAIAWLCNPASEVSAHYVVSRAGEITQLVPTARAAWHAGKSSWDGHAVRESVNAFSIGIEMEHIDGAQDWPAAQLHTVAGLCTALMTLYTIPPANVVSHAEVALPPGRKVDPQEFPWPAFRAQLITAPCTPALEIAGQRIPGRLVQNTLYVPARAACQAFGASLSYAGNAAADIARGARAGTLTGLLDGPTLYLPARALCDLLGQTAEWNEQQQALIVQA